MSGSVWAVGMAEMKHKLSVFQEVDEDIPRFIQVGQEDREGAGAVKRNTFLMIFFLHMETFFCYLHILSGH